MVELACREILCKKHHLLILFTMNADMKPVFAGQALTQPQPKKREEKTNSNLTLVGRCPTEL